MNCSACGNTLSEGSVFCEFCGAAQKAIPATDPAITVPAGQPANTLSAAPAMSRAELGEMLLRSLSLGEKFAGAGALAATLGFFLPWVSGPDLRSLGNVSTLLGGAGMGTTSYSGLDVAKIWGGTYLYLAAAIASGALFFISGKAAISRKLRISGFQVMIGSIMGPGLVFVLLFVPFMQSVAGLGLWLLGLGFCSIAVGGLVTIGHLANRA